MKRQIVAAAVLMIAINGEAHAGGVKFQGLGDLAGGNNSSQARGVSDDGRVVVGYSTSSYGAEAFRWTPEEGMVGLGCLSPVGRSFAYDVSGDGSVVVGSTDSPDAAAGAKFDEAFRWTQEEGMVGLGALPGARVDSRALGISDDGSVIMGGNRVSTSGTTYAFKWTQSGGMEQLPGSSRAFGWDASRDGSYMVGDEGTRATRWASDGSRLFLGTLGWSSANTFAMGISADGTVVVGVSPSAAFSGQNEGFRWTETGGMEGLGDLPGGRSLSVANAVSGDGSVVVGFSSTSEYSFDAFIWDRDNGMRNLQNVLVDEYGLGDSLEGWKLYRAMDISIDGKYIVGYGYNPAGETEGWMVTLPEPATMSLLAMGGLAVLRRKRRVHERRRRA